MNSRGDLWELEAVTIDSPGLLLFARVVESGDSAVATAGLWLLLTLSPRDPVPGVRKNWRCRDRDRAVGGIWEEGRGGEAGLLKAGR